jgi:hypothetical protein
MRFALELECSNAAFGNTHAERCEEIARILRALADRLDANTAEPGRLRDSNGNTVGDWNMDEQEEESL